ncbi:TPA: hypothetical protein ACX6NS_003708 [Photobacterium damselae]
MRDEEIQEYLKPLINTIESGNITKSKAIQLHVQLLLNIRSYGISVEKIISIAGIDISKRVFSSRLSEAKKRLTDGQIKKPTTAGKNLDLKPTSSDSCKTPDAVNKNSGSELKYSLSEWSNTTKFGVHGINTYKKAEAVGLCPSDFYGLNSYDRINIIQIISSWTKTVNNALIDEDQKPTKEQFLSKYK